MSIHIHNWAYTGATHSSLFTILIRNKDKTFHYPFFICFLFNFRFSVNFKLRCSKRGSCPRRTCPARSWPQTFGTSRTSPTETSATGTSTATTWTASSTSSTRSTTSSGRTAAAFRTREPWGEGPFERDSIEKEKGNEKQC